MANAVLSWVNLVDASATVLSASNTAGDLSAANLSDTIVGRRWRTTDTAGFGQADFGAAVTIGIVALLFCRDTPMPTATETIRHRFDLVTPGTGTVLDSGAIATGVRAGYGYHVYVPASPIVARYWRFTYAMPSLTYVDTGRAWAGAKFQPVRNLDFGHDETWGDLSIVTASLRSGAEFVDARARRRAWRIAFNWMTAADKDSMQEMLRVAGLGGQVLAVRDPASTDIGRDAMLGRIAEPVALARPGPVQYSAPITIRETL